MTKEEFKTAALSFEVGKIIVVSGQDLDIVIAFLQEVSDNTETETSNVSVVFDARSRITYPERWFETNSSEAKLWEQASINAKDSYTILVANEFDPNDIIQNPNPVSLTVDVVRDIFNAGKTADVPFSQSRRYGITRELYPFISKVYFYNTDTEEITYIKDNTPERP